MSFDQLVADIGRAIDAVGVAVIVSGVVVAAVVAAHSKNHEHSVYTVFRQWLGRSILLGLELLVAADIIRTVAARPTLTTVAVLAMIVLIRTFLSLSLELEIAGRWPWQQRRSEGPLADPPDPRPRDQNSGTASRADLTNTN